MYTNADFARGLEEEVARGFDVVRIAQWAYQSYLDNMGNLQPGLHEQIMDVVLMEEPQFEMCKEEVLSLISSLH